MLPTAEPAPACDGFSRQVLIYRHDAEIDSSEELLQHHRACWTQPRFDDDAEFDPCRCAHHTRPPEQLGLDVLGLWLAQQGGNDR